MTKDNVVDAVSDRQAGAILRRLEQWCSAQPGRRFSVELTPDGWRAAVDEQRTASGSTMADALAQVATAVSFEQAAEAYDR